MSPDLASVRARMPSLAGETYLNTGGCGPLVDVAARAMTAWSDAALTRGRGSPAGFGAVAEEAERLRASVAPLVGGRADEIALTANTTAGVNVVAWGIDWRAGDEIVMPALEHPGMSVPLATIARRHGVVLRLVDRDGTGRGLVDEVAAVVGPRTRLVALSHVAWSTGAVLDIAGAARVAHAAGALVLVDGAQSVGAIAVDAPALDADAYAFPAHKWLLGPTGLGAVWIASRALDRIDLTHAGFESGTGHAIGGVIDLHSGARRHEVSTLPGALLPAWRATLEWMQGLGWEWVHARVAEARAGVRGALAGIPGVEVITPPGTQAGLVTFAIPGRDAADACAELGAAGVVVRWLEHPPALRVSAGFFTDEGDLEHLATAVRAVVPASAASLQ